MCCRGNECPVGGINALSGGMKGFVGGNEGVCRGECKVEGGAKNLRFGCEGFGWSKAF